MVRFKNRYLVATVVADSEQLDGLKTTDILAFLKESIATNYGDMAIGMTAPSLQVRSYDAVSRVFIVRVSRDCHQMVRAALTLVSGTDAIRLSFSVVGVAGCERTLKTVAMAAYERAYRQAGMDSEDVAVLLKRRAEALGV